MSIKDRLAAEFDAQKLNGYCSDRTANDCELKNYNPHDGGPALTETREERPPIERFTARTLAANYPRLHAPVIGHLQRAMETLNLISVSKIGKSWLLYSLLFCIVTGRPWLGRFPTAKGKVLLIDNELHRATLASRLKTVADAMGIKEDEYADDFDIWPLRGRLRNLFEIGPELESVAGVYQFIGIDAKYRMTPQGASESDNAAETWLYNEIDRLAELTGAAFGLVHHSSKGSQSDKRITDIGSGAGAQSRAVDCHFTMREHEDENAVVVGVAVRSFPPVEPFVLRWQFPLWVVDEAADPEALKGKKSPGEEGQARKDDEADELVLRLAKDWKTREQLKKDSGFGYTRLDRCIRRLLDDDRLDETTEDRAGKEVRLLRRSEGGF